MIKKITAVFAISLFLFGCENNPDNEQNDYYSCTTSVEPGIIVEIRDAITDEPLAENAIAVITSGDYRETLIITHYEGVDSSTAYAVSGAYERAGVYNIEVTLTGYKNWLRYDVEVTDGVCHVGTVRYTARLEAI